MCVCVCVCVSVIFNINSQHKRTANYSNQISKSLKEDLKKVHYTQQWHWGGGLLYQAPTWPSY